VLDFHETNKSPKTLEKLSYGGEEQMRGLHKATMGLSIYKNS